MSAARWTDPTGFYGDTYPHWSRTHGRGDFPALFRSRRRAERIASRADRRTPTWTRDEDDR